MKIRNLKVSTQIIVGFIVMLLFLLSLGFMSYFQAYKIHQQTETIYNHPLQVRTALGRLLVDISQMRLGVRDLMLTKTEVEKQDALFLMKAADQDAEKQFSILKTQFLGPKMLVDSAYEDFTNWKILREDNIKLALAGKIEEVKSNVKDDGKVGEVRNNMLQHLNTIDGYASRKAVALYAESADLKTKLNYELSFLIFLVLIFSILIMTILLRNIRNPIKALAEATNLFRAGDLDARSDLDIDNEFGELSLSFNLLVDQVKQNIDLTKKTEQLADAMLVVNDSHRFFRELLPVLSELTNSQIAAVYLLSEEKDQYFHYESIGMTDSNIASVFVAKGMQGEFGAAIATHKIQHIKNIPIDTQFVFSTVGGKIIPREIITIPIVSGIEVIACISLASVRSYTVDANKLIDGMYDILTARIEGILAYRNMRKFSKQLELQNVELESQKTELASQSLELTVQNHELEIQRDQLNEISQLKTSFLSNMSHELRTPLNSVIALTGVLNRRLTDKIPAEEYSYLEVIERNGKHLLTLINDILDISRIEAGREELEISTFDINSLIAEVVSMIKPQADQKGIQLLQTGSEVKLEIVSDMEKCRHILQNLVANAVKFTEKGGVEIRAVKVGTTIQIAVTDTGIGISIKHLPHIFDEFRQADGSTSRRFGGTGLGLAIARKYANLMGGNVTVQSVVDQGSTFNLNLPLEYSANSAESAELAMPFNRPNYAHPQPPTEQKTILIVEDSDSAVIQLKDILAHNAYQVIDARNGEQALSIISDTIPDAIILDLMMPGIDGFDVLTQIRNAEETAHIPVLILTAKHITKEDLKMLKRNNIHQLIQKGDINRNELLNAVASMVQQTK